MDLPETPDPEQPEVPENPFYEASWVAPNPEPVPTSLALGGLNISQPAESPAVTFIAGGEATNRSAVLEFFTDGRVYVRGELVDNNKEIYAALVDFLYQTGTAPNDSREYRRREGLDKPPESRGKSRFEILKDGTPDPT